MDYKYNRRYFDFINWLVIAFIILVGLILCYFILLLGIAVLLGVGSYIFYKLYYKPVEADIDIVYEEQAHIAIREGYERLGLNPSDVQLIDPIVIHGPLLNNIRLHPAVVKGKDQQVRSSNHEVIVFYFNEKQIYYYKCSFSVIDHEMNEAVGEVFYQDIVSISISSTMTPYVDVRTKRENFFNLDVMELNISGGTTIQCPIGDLNRAEPGISAMKDILREKKSAS